MTGAAIYSQRIDRAVTPLLLAKDLLDQFLPTCDDEETAEIAVQFARRLMALSISRLSADNIPEAGSNVVDFEKVELRRSMDMGQQTTNLHPGPDAA